MYNEQYSIDDYGNIYDARGNFVGVDEQYARQQQQPQSMLNNRGSQFRIPGTGGMLPNRNIGIGTPMNRVNRGVTAVNSNGDIRSVSGAAVPNIITKPTYAQVDTPVQKPTVKEEIMPTKNINMYEYPPLIQPGLVVEKVKLNDTFFKYEVKEDKHMDENTHKWVYEDPKDLKPVKSELPNMTIRDNIAITDSLKYGLDMVELQSLNDDDEENIIYEILIVKPVIITNYKNEKVSTIYKNIIEKSETLLYLSRMLYDVKMETRDIVYDKAIEEIDAYITKLINESLNNILNSKNRIDCTEDIKEMYDWFETKEDKQKYINVMADILTNLKKDLALLETYEEEVNEIIDPYITENYIPLVIPTRISVCHTKNYAVDNETVRLEENSTATVQDMYAPQLDVLLTTLDKSTSSIMTTNTINLLITRNFIYKLYYNNSIKKYNIRRL